MKYFLILFLFSNFWNINLAEQTDLVIFPCFYTNQKILVDGALSEKAWKETAWSDDFVDIRGDDFPKPIHNTQFKILWNKTHLFIAAKITDPHLWATMQENESPLYQEDAFEVFIDPENDGLDYFEFEINPLGTTWDLQMNKPYVDGGKPNSKWNIDGLKKGIQVNGTIDNPTDEDDDWTVEIAIPIANFFDGERQCKKDLINQVWSVNFLRTDWGLDIRNNQYSKPKNTEAAARFWVWKPHGVINMHLPSHWGKIQLLPKTIKTD